MLESLLIPRSVAVIGASRDPHKVGHQIFANLLSFGEHVYPVHPTITRLLGKKVYKDILSIPVPVDLVVVATPLATVEDIVNQCVDKKVGSIVIITAGFAESTKKGKAIQSRLVALARHHNIRIVGPNTLGIANPHHKLNASFAKSVIEKGSIALISQSGAMLTTIFEEFSSRQVGCSFAISLGNSADVEVTDALEFAQEDPHTKVIALYLESLPNPQAFFALTKKISQSKPIILLKGGISKQGQHASLSHTAALATDHVLLEAASAQMGFTIVDTIEQFFETSFFIDQQVKKNHALPKNCMIITNAGGPGVNAVDIAQHDGLPLAEWSKESVKRFAFNLPRVTPNNPTDLIGDASTKDVEHALAFAGEDENIESIVLIITPQAVTDVPAITNAIIRFSKEEHAKPLVTALMGGEDQHASIVKLRDHGICAVEYANEAIEVITHTYKVAKGQEVDRSAAIMATIEHKLLATKRESYAQVPLKHEDLGETYILLEKYGLTLPRCAIVRSATQLDELDALDPNKVYPLVAKTANLGLKHKAVLGGVILGIESKDDVKKAYKKLSKFGSEVLLQEVIADATEVIVGAKRDPVYGLFLAIGSGGSLTNILADRAYVFLPATSKELRKAFLTTKLHQRLSAEQRSLLLLCLERLARLMVEHGEICELEINPLMVTAHEAYVADVKVQLK